MAMTTPTPCALAAADAAAAIFVAASSDRTFLSSVCAETVVVTARARIVPQASFRSVIASSYRRTGVVETLSSFRPVEAHHRFA